MTTLIIIIFWLRNNMVLGNNLSTEAATFNLLNNILDALNNKYMVGGIFCDLSKAFDCINHSVLLTKLQFYGITCRAYNLLSSYLCDRYQWVLLKNADLGNCFSEWEKVKLGVPQGSILGPLFFYSTLMTCRDQWTNYQIILN